MELADGVSCLSVLMKFPCDVLRWQKFFLGNKQKRISLIDHGKIFFLFIRQKRLDLSLKTTKNRQNKSSYEVKHTTLKQKIQTEELIFLSLAYLKKPHTISKNNLNPHRNQLAWVQNRLFTYLQTFNFIGGINHTCYFIHKVILVMHCRLARLLFKFSELYPKHPNLSTTGTTFKASELVKNIRSDLLPLPKFEASSLPFGKYHSDHIISVDYDIKTGWGKPTLGPYQPLNLDPFSSCLHYGMKAYRNEKGEVRIFRPEANAARLKRSSVRLTLPDFDGNELVNLIQEIVKVEERWIPPFTEFSLYIRPLHIANDDALGVKRPDKSKLLIMTGPVGPYYPTGFKPISLSCATETIRSAPKGTGSYKLGGNYAPTLQASSRVASEGHQQALWLLGDQVIEVGASNIFFIFKDKSGDIQIATPELEDLILPGVTRDSILQLLRDEKKYKITERKIMIQQVIEKQKRGELIECFGAGTAVIISGVKNIEYKGTNYNIPVDEKLGIGRISAEIRQKILDIQEGRGQDKYGWVRRIK